MHGPHELTFILAVIFRITLFGVGFAALLLGDRPEKIGALVNICASLASAALRVVGLASWAAGGPTLLIDIAAAGAFYWLGCRTIRFWPVWSFGLVLAVVSVDIVKLALPHVTPFAFASGQIVYVYLALLSLALGTYRAARSPRDAHHGFRPPCPPNPPSPPTRMSDNS